MTPLVSIIIPAYNESSRIVETLERVTRFMREKLYQYEVLVVDDGSSDDTGEKVTAHRAIDGRVSLLSQDMNRGKGAAVARGMLEANGKWRLFMDADSSVDIEHLDAFLGYTRLGCDVVIGSIAMTPRRADNNGIMRKVLRLFGKRLIRALATPGIADTQRGFKLFSDEAAEAIFSRMSVERWGFDIEALVIARSHGFQIAEVPVLWNNPPGHTVSLRSYGATLIELMWILMRKWTGAYAPVATQRTIGEIVRFGIAGGMNTLVDILTFNALIMLFGVATPLLVIYKTIGFCAAVTNSYFWNKYFVFGTRGTPYRNANPMRFLFVSVVALCINTTAFLIAETLLSTQPLSPTLIANLAAIIATIASLGTNYLGYKFLVFQH